MSKEIDLVYCLWEDIMSSDTGWKSRDEAIEWADSEPSLVHQTGFVLDDDGEFILLVDSYFKNCETVGTVTRIPKQNIKFIKKIPIIEFIK